MTEERFTLKEAKAELARRECARSGHDFKVWEQARTFMQPGDLAPLGVQCVRCLRIWNIGEERSHD